MDQAAARRIAKLMGGIATTGRKGHRPGQWNLGGWGSRNPHWLVVSLDQQDVWHDGTYDLRHPDLVKRDAKAIAAILGRDPITGQPATTGTEQQ